MAAARIGEIMSGRTFEEDLQSLVFSKLGMGAGTLSDRAYLGRNLHRLAKPYVFDQSEVNRNVGDNMWVRLVMNIYVGRFENCFKHVV